MKKFLAAGLAAVMALTMFVPAMAEEETETEAVKEYTNNVNDPDYEWPDYSGETLSFMWWGSDTRHQLTIEVIEKYEELTGLDIEYEYYDGSGYWTQYQAKMASNSLPDVVQMGNNWLTYYDTIVPLN